MGNSTNWLQIKILFGFSSKYRILNKEWRRIRFSFGRYRLDVTTTLIQHWHKPAWHRTSPKVYWGNISVDLSHLWQSWRHPGWIPTQNWLGRGIHNYVVEKKTTKLIKVPHSTTNRKVRTKTEREIEVTWDFTTFTPGPSFGHFFCSPFSFWITFVRKFSGTCHCGRWTENESRCRDPLACSLNRKTVALTSFNRVTDICIKFRNR